MRDYFVFYGLPFYLITAAFAGRPAINRDSIQPIVYVNRDVASTVITCEADDFGISISYAWYFENTPLTSSTDTDVTPQMNTLTFTSGVAFSASGWYTCVASNEFGTDFLDFLVVIGAPPRFEIALASANAYAVVPMSRVELPCVVSGLPHPDIQWFTDNEQNEIMDGDGGGDYSINAMTGSLIIRRYRSSYVPQTGFFCRASNMFQTIDTERVLIPLTQTPDPAFRTLLNDVVLTESTEIANLTCTDISSQSFLMDNFTFEWTRNEEIVPSSNMNSLTVSASSVNASGYYCCEVSQTGMLVATFCTTVFVRFDPMFVDTTVRDAAVGRLRKAYLYCQATTPNFFELPTLGWQDENGNTLSNSTSVQISPEQKGFTYLTYTGQGGKNFSCVDINNTDSLRRTFQIQTAGGCDDSDTNIIENGNGASLENWGTGGNAIATRVDNEDVFKLDYDDQATFPTLKQTFGIQAGAGVVLISGRIRQIERTTVGTSTRAVIRLMLNNVEIGELRNDHPERDSWQDKARELTFEASQGSVMDLLLTLEPLPMTQRTNGGVQVLGSAFFDDICASVQIEPAGGLTQQLSIIIGAVVGGVCVILLLMFLVVLCCCCCFFRRKKSNTKMMRKMSTIVAKKFGRKRYVSEPDASKDAAAIYNTADDTGSTMKRATQDEELYESVDDISTEGRIQTEDSLYINPKNYQQAETELGTQGGDDDGHYTAIDRNKLDRDNLYMTASRERLASPDGATGSEYLQVLGSLDQSKAQNGTTVEQEVYTAI